MLYGIELTSSKKWLKKCAKEYREDVSVSDRLDVYFSNPITAVKVASDLEEQHESFSYNVFELTAEQEKLVDKSRIADTFEQFQTMHADFVGEAIGQKSEQAKVNRIFANFKSKFDGMTEEEQDKYLIDNGLKFRKIDDKEM